MTNEDVTQVTLPSWPIQATIPEGRLLRYTKFSFDNSDAISNAPCHQKMQLPGALEGTACVSRILTLEFLRLEVRESIKVNRIKCFTIIDPPAYDFAHWTRSFPPTKLLN